jgi:hypothetical protein
MTQDLREQIARAIHHAQACLNARECECRDGHPNSIYFPEADAVLEVLRSPEVLELLFDRMFGGDEKDMMDEDESGSARARMRDLFSQSQSVTHAESEK